MPSEPTEEEVREVARPGSPEAIAQGCLCPVINNHHGKGVPNGDGPPLYWYSGNCTLHGGFEAKESER